jgi:peptidoglycan/xylan/chitin deacetylase (PgdA/CDA1 family)
VARPAAAPTTSAPPAVPRRAPGVTTTAPPPAGPAVQVVSGRRDSDEVALTFHGSGEVALTDELLAVVARLKAPITVFAVGTWLEQNPDVGARILAAGHELANHTYTHPALGSAGRSEVAAEIQRCRDVLVRQTGANGRWFRPSGMDRSTPLVLEEAGAAGYRTVVAYDVDPLDYQDPGAPAIIQRVQAGARPGSIVSLHLGHSGTVAAIEPVITSLRNRGLRPVTVGELLA